MKQIREILVLFASIGGILFMSGCSISIEKDIKDYLSDKYGGDFIVHSVISEGQVYHAICSPVYKEDVVFDVRIESDGTPDGSDNFASRYTSVLVNDVIKEDLKEFFNEYYCYTDIGVYCQKELTDLKGKNLEDIFFEADAEKSYCNIYVFFSNENGSYGKYREEYEYFTKTIDEYIKEGKIGPVTVSFYKVDSSSIKKLEEFFKNHEMKELYTGNYFEEIFGIESVRFQQGDCSKGKSDLGNPPNVDACFNKNFVVISGEEEYIRRRELIDNE